VRVLFTAHGAYGHVLPLLGTARSLVGGGHDVVVATAPGFCPVVASAGLEPYPAGVDDDALVAEARRRWPETASRPPAEWAPRMFCEIAAPAMAADVAPFIRRWRPDVVVREEGEHGGAVASAAAGVPWITHGWGSPLQGPEALVELGRLVAPLWERAGLRAPVGAEMYGAAVLDPCPPSLYGELPALAHRHGVRATSAGGRREPGSDKATGRPLAYVGFGTVPLFRDEPELTKVAVDALVAQGFDVTATTGEAHLARQLERAHPGRVRVEGWVQLPELLASCDLAVCHGGAGTVLSALAAGVPLVLLPRGAPSQLRMSEACEARGVGRAVAWNGTNGDEVRAAVVDVTSSPHFRATAAAVAKELAAMPDPSTAGTVLAGVAAIA
jgi:UDP:flavonoid glycosyltransferase YjiC (YdhE family)